MQAGNCSRDLRNFPVTCTLSIISCKPSPRKLVIKQHVVEGRPDLRRISATLSSRASRGQEQLQNLRPEQFLQVCINQSMF